MIAAPSRSSLRMWVGVPAIALALATASSVRADGPSIDARVQNETTARNGIAVGVEVGEPSAITVAWWMERYGISAALGTGTVAGVGVSAHVDGHVEVLRITPDLVLDAGLGARIYHHGYEAMSFDEIPDTHYGIRASIAVAFDHEALRVYAELAPGIDIHRSASCTLASGPYSICPHAQQLPVFAQAVIGARWFLSN